MRLRKSTTATVAAALLSLGLALAPVSAAAEQCSHQFGMPEQLTDAGGAVVEQWTVADLHKVSPTLPGYTPQDQIWEATVTVHAVNGTVTPIIPNLYAMSGDGGRYPVLWQVASPQGLPGATLAQGQTSSGTVYFDATGTDPMGVMFDSPGNAPLMWCCDDAMAMPMDTCPCCNDAMMQMDNCPCCNDTPGA